MAPALLQWRHGVYRPMRAARIAPLFFVVACGEVGLVEYVGDDGEALVAVEPQGQIRFDRASPEGRSQSEEVLIVSAGDASVYVADVWVETSTASVFYTGNELPFPRYLDAGDEIPVVIHFSPVAVGTFHGTLVVESGLQGALLERQLVGEGCSDPDRDGSC